MNNIRAEIIDPFLTSLSYISASVECKDYTNDDLQKLLSDNLNSLSYEIYELLNKSIFKGEYVNTSDFIESLNNFDEILSLFQNDLLGLDVDVIIQEFIKKNIQDSILKEIISSSNAYRRFVTSLEDRISFSNTKLYINTLVKTRYDFVNLKSTSITDDCKVFDSNLFIAYCDHFVSSVDKDVLLNLEDVLYFLRNKKSQNNSIELLYKKALFIRYKFIFREIEEQRQLNEGAVIYVANKERNDVFDPIDFVNNHPNLELFKVWSSYMLNHYQINSQWVQNISHEVKLASDFSTLTIRDLHEIIKYAKDVEKDYNLIIRVRDEFKNRLVLASDPFDKYCLKICTIYAYNNQISFLAEKEGLAEIEIENLYNEIEIFISVNRVRNYFATAKYLRYITKSLKKMIDDKLVFDNYDDCQNKLLKAYQLITQYKKNIDWVKRNYNYTFQLPKEECEILIDGSNKLFIASSFMLPISRVGLELNFKTDLESINVFKIIIEALSFTKDSKDEIQKLSNQNSVLASELKANEKSKLETIAIVTAIMTFVAGSIPGFKFIDSGIEAISFTLSLGLSLALFALLFFGISRGFKSIRIYFLTSLPLILFSWYLLYFVSNLKEDFNKDEDIANKVYDQIKKESSKPKANTIKSKNK